MVSLFFFFFSSKGFIKKPHQRLAITLKFNLQLCIPLLSQADEFFSPVQEVQISATKNGHHHEYLENEGLL
jgi:hypothetical protein